MPFYVKNKNRKTAYTSLLLFLGIVTIITGWSFGRSVFAQSSGDSIRQIPISASLFDNKNRIISRGAHQVRFALYTVNRTTPDPYPSNTDIKLWEETQTVQVRNGVFRASLGAFNPFPANVNFESGSYYIGIRMDSDSELIPRKKLGSVPRAINSQYLQGRVVGSDSGNIPALDENGKLSADVLPISSKDGNNIDLSNLLAADDEILDDIHAQNTDTGTKSKIFNIGAKTSLGSNNFDLTVSSASNAPTLRYNAGIGSWQLSNNGTSFSSIANGADYLALSGGTMTGNIIFDSSQDFTNLIDLGTDTVGNYVASIANGNGITGGGAGSEGGALTLGIDLLSAADGTGLTGSESGLEFGGAGNNELTLLQGCANGQALGWNDISNVWECTSYSAGLSGSGSTGYVTYWSGPSALGAEAQLNVSRGGTGIDATGAANGSILIGNGGGFSLSALTQGAGVSISNGSGTITIASTLGTSVDLTTEVTGTLPVANGGTGATTLTSNGVVLGNGTSAVQVTSAGTNGQIFIGSTGVAPLFATLSSDATISNTGVLTISSDAVALGADTTGNYVASITNGNGISGSSSTEGGTPTIALDLLDSDDGTGLTSSNSGLEFAGTGNNELSLIQGCANGQGISYNTTTEEWECTTFSAGLAGSGSTGQVAYWSGTSSLSGENQLSTSRGGTGVDGSGAANGSLLIGNGTGYSLTTLTDGAGITITEGSGTITIASTLGTSVDLTSEVTGTLPVANGGTGATTLTSNGVVLGNGTSAVQVTSAGTNGQIFIGSTGVAPLFATLSSDATISNTGVLTISSDAVALGADTTGNYVASITNGNGISGSSSSEGGTPTIALDLLDSDDGTGLTSSNSGLEFAGTGNNELSLIQGCANGQGISYNTTTEEWECTTFSAGLAGSGSTGQVAYWSGTSSLSGENQLSTSRGGTGVDGSAAANGTLLIGNGTGYTLGTLTDGAGITITEGSGTITIASTLGTSVDLTTEVTGTLPVANGGTGATTLTSNGVVLGNGTSAVQVTSAGTNGQIFIGSTGVAPLFATLSSDATISNTGVLTISTDAVALGTDTTGNYVASITNGNGISGSSSTEGGTPTIALDLLDSDDGTGLTSSNSGLEFAGTGNNELSLIQGCANGQGISYNTTTEEWECTTFSAGLAGSGSTGQVAYWSGTSSLSGENQLSTSRGGTGVDGSAAANGTLLIGNGTGYTLATLTDGAGITITEGTGTITIASTLGTSVDLASEVTGTLPVANGGTGATTLTSNGVVLGNGTSAVQVTSAGTNGQIFIGSTGVAPLFATLSSDATISNTGVLTISSDAVALGADTTGNYVASITNGNGISGSSSSEGGTPTIALDLLDSDDGTGLTSSNSGLEFAGTGNNELSLIQGCANGQGISYNTTTEEWECTTFSAGLAGSGSTGQVAYWSGTSSLSGENQLSTSRGGTGVDGSAAANGTLLIGNGTGYTLATLTDGAGITITEGTGTITIASTLGTSVDLTSEVTGTLPVANGGTGATTLTSNGVVLGNGTSAVQVTSAGTNGQIFIGSTGVAPLFATLSSDATISNTGVLTISTDAVALGTDTTGNYVATITNGNGISGSSSSEGGTPTIALDLLDSDDGTGLTSSNSGLEFAGTGNNELSLIQGCANGQGISYNTTTEEWECTTFSAGLAGSGSTGQVAYWSGTSSLSGENQLSTSRGGTGVDGSAAANGTLLIGNGTGYTLATLTDGAGITITEGTGTITIASTLGTSVDLTTEVTGTLPVANGGTGATTLTSNGVVLGNGTSAVQVTSAGTNGQIFIGSTGVAPLFATLSSDATISNTGVLTISTDAVALGTDTTGNYVATITNGNGISGSSSSEGGTPTLSIDLLDSADGTGSTSSNSGLEFQGTGSNELTLIQGCADNEVLAWNDTTNIWECSSIAGSGGVTGTGTNNYVTYWTGTSSIAAEAQLSPVRGGTGVDGSAAANGTLLIGNGTGYTLATLTDGAGITITEGTGTITIASTLGTSVDLTSEVTGTLPVANGGTGATTLNDLIALTTNTTGNYVATITNGNGISGSSSSEGGTPTLSIDLLDSADGTGSTSSNSGLEFQGTGSNELTLIQGCADNEVLAWNDTTNIWECSSIAGSGGVTGTGTNNYVTYWTGTSSIAAEAQLSPVRGGTGVDGSAAANGTLLIGNGTGYTLATLTDGAGITITEGTGTITIASTLGTSVDLASEVTGTLPVANGGTGATTLTSNGVVLGNGTSAVQVTSAGTNGQIFIGSTGVAPLFATLSSDATISNTGVLTISTDAVALGTDTTGNYVASITNGNGISGSSSTEGGTPTIALDLLDSVDSTGVTSSNSGLEFQGSSSNELTLLQGCADNEVLAWNETSDVWNCASVSGVGGATASGSTGQVAYFTGTSSLAGENQLNVSRGGTGVDGSGATNGQLLIGNGSGYSLATLTQGSGITVTNGSGTITIAATLGTDIVGSEIVDGTIEEVDFEATNSPTNGYILSYDNATGGFTWIANTGGTGSSKWTDSGSITYLTETTDDLAIGGSTATASRFFFDVTNGNQIVFEGTGADDANETTLIITNPTADRTLTLPNLTGTVALIDGGQTFTSATWNASTIGAQYGGTGINGASAANGTLLIGNGTGYTLATLTDGAGITITEGVGTITIASTLGTSVDLTTEVTGTLPVGNGGTGATTLTSNGVVIGNGTSAVQVTAAGTNGQLFLGSTGVAPAFATMSGDATITNAGVLSIASDSIALTTDTTGNYVATITNGNGISGSSSSEGGTPTIALGNLTANWNQTGAFDISLNNAASELQILESTGGTFFGILDAGDLSADRTITIPDASGTLLISGSTLFTVAGTSGVSQSIASGDTITIAAGAGVTTTGGATDTITIATTLGTSVDLTTEVTGTLPVGNGGTGATTLTSNGVVIGNGTSAVQVTAAGTNGQLFLGSTGVAPAFATMSGDATIDNAGALTISSNAVALTTDTTGNYVATITSGNGISGSSSTEGGTPTISVRLLTSDDGTGLTASNSGLEFQGASNELSLLQGCGNNEVLSYNTTTEEWTCSSVSGVGGVTGSGTSGQVAYFNGTSSITGENQLNVSRGGTGVNGSAAANGTLLIGNGTGYTLSTLTDGTGITITEGVGTITIASTLGTSVDLTTEVTGTLPVGNGGTGATTLTSNGVVIGNGTSAVQVTAAGTDGQVLIGNSGNAPAFFSVTGDADLSELGTLTINANSVALTTDTTGNYVATITNGNGISGSSSSEGGTPTIALGNLTANWNQTGAFDISLNNAASELQILESTGGTFFGILDAGDLSADRTITIPDASGTLLISGSTLFTVAGTSGVSQSIASGDTITIAAGAGVTTTGGATDTITIATTLGTSVDLTTEVTGTLPVGNGGTGATTLTSNGVVIGNGTSAVQVTAAGTNGQLFLGSTGVAPAFATMSGDATITNAGVLSIAADSVALTTDTTGNYVATITNGNGISGSSATEGGTPTLSIDLLDSDDGTGSTSSNSGLEFAGTGNNELTLLQGCANNEVLAYNTTTEEWNCATVSGVGGATASGSTGQVAYFSGTSSLVGENQLNPSRGGTGVNGSAAGNGTLLIGNGTGYSLTTLTDGTGITITEGVGTITIASTLGTSVDLTTEVTGTLPVGNGGTGATTLTSNGVVIGNGTSAVQVTAAGTNGQLFLGSTGVAPAFATMSGDATIDNAGALTISSNAVALTTDTTGNYVATITSGNGISGSSSTEGGTPTISVRLLTSDDGTGLTASNSGLEFQGASNELSLLQGCGNNEVLSYNTTTEEWTCSSVSGVGGVTGSGTSGQVAYFNGTSSITGENQLNVSRGGTGVNGSAAANGTLLIGNGTGYTLSTLTDGTGITITEGVGTITIASTLGTSVDLTTEVTGTLPVGNGGTGATTLTSNGVVIGNGTSAVQVTAAGTDGQVLIGNSGNAPAFFSVTGDADLSELGTLTINANSVALTTDTTGNYVATITNGNGISGSSSSEGGTPTIALGNLTANWNQTGAFDISLNNAASELQILESTGGTFFGILDAGDLSADRTITIPDASGTLLISGSTLFTVAGTSGVSQSIASGDTITIAAGAGVTTTGGATDTITIATTLGTSVDLTTEVTGTLPVGNGGTGATTLTSNGVVIGNGTSAVQVTAAGTNGQLFLGSTGVAPAFATMSGDATITNAGVLSIAADSVALTTDTTGNYVATITNGNGISGSSSSEGGTPTLAIDLLDSVDSTGVTSSNSGLEFQGAGNNELTLLQGCADNEVLSWDETSDVWNCDTIVGAGGVTGTGTNNYATYWTGTGTIAAEAQLNVSRGGTGVNGSTAANGTLLIGNGTGYTLATLTDGAGITITEGSGTITIASTLGTSVDLASEVTGTLPVANGGTGTATAFTTGSIVFAGASGVYTQDNTKFFFDNTNDRLGIGTATPGAALSLGGTTAAGIGATHLRVYESGTNAYGFGVSAGTFSIHAGTAGATVFSGGAVGSEVERARISAGGLFNVGGNASPTNLFSVGSTSQFQVNSTGAIAAATGITSSGTITFSALSVSGGVLYTNSSGVLAQDSGNFIWDATNNRLGIGTASPLSPLNIFGTSNALRLSYDVSNYGTVSANSAGSLVLSSSNTTEAQFILGGGASTDSSIAFDGASQDYYAGLDHTTGSYMIGSGFVVGTSPYVTITSTGNVGIGDTTPDAKLDFDFASTNTTAGTEYGGWFTTTDTGVVTTGTDATYGNRIDLTRSGATGGTINNYGQYVDLSGTAPSGSPTINNYGAFLNVNSNTTGVTTNIALWASVSGADTNYAGIFTGGNVGIGDTSPSALFTVGSGDLFQINSSGAFSNTVATGVAGTITNTGTSNSFVVNDAAGDTTPFAIDASGNLLMGTSTVLGDITLSRDGNNATAYIASYGSVSSSLYFGNTNGTEASPTATLTGNILGNMYFQGYDTALSSGARIYAEAAADWGTAGDTTDNPANIVFATAADGSSTLTQQMVITSGGLVGIGDASPASLFTVGSGDLFQINSSGVIASSNNITPNSVFTTGQTDEYCLTYEATGTTWEWASCGGAGGANTALSNLSAVAINTSLLPGTDDSIDLGDDTHRWRDLYLGGETIHIGTSTTDEAVVSYTTSTNLLNFSTDATSNGDIAFFSDDLYLDKSTGFVGIGDTSPDAKFDVDFSSTNATAGTEYGSYFTVTDSGVVTTGSDNTYANAAHLFRSGATGGNITNYGQYVYTSGTFASGTGNIYNYGVRSDVSGNTTGTSYNYGISVNSQGADTNYGLYAQSAVASGTINYGLYSTLSDSTTTATTSYASFLQINDTGVVTTGTDSNYGNRIDLTRTGATGGTLNNYGGHTSLTGTFASGTGTVNNYGQYINVTGNTTGTSTNYGLHVTVASADTNYSGIFQGGNFGIGTVTPSNTLHVAEAVAGSANIRSSGPSSDNNWAGGIEFTSHNGTTVTSKINASSTGLFFTYGGTERMRIDSSGNLGVGDTTPDAKLDFDFASTNTTAGTEYGSYFTISDTGVVTTGTDATYGNRIDLTRSGATGGTINNYGQYVDLSGTAPSGSPTVNNYGAFLNVNSSTTGVTTNVALWASASGADTNYAGIFNNGSVGIGDTSPDHLLDVAGNIGLSASSYINWGDTDGSTGYGFRDNAGTIEYKNSGGSWAAFGGGGMSIGGSVTSATAGSVFFAGTSGVLEQDNASFFFDNTNNRLGLGTASPAAQLSIFGTSNAARFSYDVSNYGTISADATGNLSLASSNTSETALLIGTGGSVDASVQYDGSAGDFYAGIDQTSGMYTVGSGLTVGSAAVFALNSSGDVGIGTGVTAPGARLDVLDDVASDYAMQVYNDGNASTRWGMSVQAGADSAGTGTLIQFLDGDGTDVGEITFSGTTTTYSTTSDRRLKENIRPTAYSLSDLMNIEVRDYEFKVDGMSSTGIVAQDLYEIYPYAVSRPADEMTQSWGIDYGLITPLIIKAVQEQNGVIEGLQDENDERIADISDLNLSVSNTITTLGGLQTAVTNDLQVISGDVQALNGSVDAISNDIAGLDARTTTLETQMQTLTDQVTVLSEFYTTFDLGNLVAKDLAGNVDLLDGKLRAKILETGALSIETVDAAAPTLGKATITTGQASVTINTTAVVESSRIFVTAKSASALSFPLTVTAIVPGASFTVGIPQTLGTDIEFDWWIVQSQ